jgi:hypothetical protein
MSEIGDKIIDSDAKSYKMMHDSMLLLAGRVDESLLHCPTVTVGQDVENLMISIVPHFKESKKDRKEGSEN